MGWIVGGEKTWKHALSHLPFAIQCDKCDIEVVYIPRRNIHSSIHTYIFMGSPTKSLSHFGPCLQARTKGLQHLINRRSSDLMNINN
jgi:hypothetical protein